VLLQWQDDLFHDPIRLTQDLDDLLIVHHIVKTQRPPLAVLQPFLRGLISTDVEFPCDLGDALEILVGVDVNAAYAPLS
jgi:hypothetical protein